MQLSTAKKGEKKEAELASSKRKDADPTALNLLAITVESIEVTLPALLESQDLNASGFSVSSAVDLSRRSVKLVELLFPSFNRLTPALFDTILPHLPKPAAATQRALSTILRLVANLVGFSWRHQVFPKVIMPAMHEE